MAEDSSKWPVCISVSNAWLFSVLGHAVRSVQLYSTIVYTDTVALKTIQTDTLLRGFNECVS